MSKPRKHYLTKSRFKLALECPTKLFYTGKSEEYADTKDENEFLQALADGGYQVGELAKYYYPDGIEVEGLDYEGTLRQTNQLLEREEVTLFEAAILHEDCFIRVDILEKKGNRVNLIEVKAKSFNGSEKGFPVGKQGFIYANWLPYIEDVAFQTRVVKQAHREWEITPYLMLADKDRVATVNGLNQLFRVERATDNPKHKRVILAKDTISPDDLGDQILDLVPMQEYIDKIFDGSFKHDSKKSDEEKKSFVDRIHEYTEYYKQDRKYPPRPSRACGDCEFRNDRKPHLKSGYQECWKTIGGTEFDIDEPHVLDIWYRPQVELMLSNGDYYIRDVDPEGYLQIRTGDDGLSRTERQALQIRKVQENDRTEYLHPGLKEKMDTWKYPLHFIDFETSMAALPFFKGQRPYQWANFQFSAHILHEDGRVEHKEYICAQPGKFPNYEMVENLRRVLGERGSIFRYAAHENTVLRQIHDQMKEEPSGGYQELMAWIDTVTEDKKMGHVGKRNMINLQKVVVEYYYNPSTNGSNSLKYVLPAIMNHSPMLERIYSKPQPYGTHLRDMILHQRDVDGSVMDPYALLPPIFEADDLNRDQLDLEEMSVTDGGQAMVAYGYLQYTDRSQESAERIKQGLLQYCELDTLAMKMLYEHLLSIVSSA